MIGRGLLASMAVKGFYGPAVKTLGFQLKYGGLNPPRSVGRIILFFCTKRHFIGNNGYFCL